MKKTNNKGFSLVELIIVIAIMAILAGAIAPALIRYIDKSRKSNDVSAAKTIKTAIETVMSNETAYEALTALPASGSAASITDLDGNVIKYAGKIKIQPNDSTANAVGITSNDANANLTDAQAEIKKNIGEKTPKISYKKKADDTHQPAVFYAYISEGGSVVVGLAKADGTDFYQLAPTVSKYYQ